MPSPFPGMNPFVEWQRWSSFHSVFNAAVFEWLSDTLPERYSVTIEQDATVTEIGLPSETSPPTRRPDVAIAEANPTGPSPIVAERSVKASDGWFELELSEIDIPLHRWIEIRLRDGRRVVTVIETLSPGNKTGGGRECYLRKRNEIVASPTHLVELDLLLGGRRLPPLDGIEAPSQRFDYYALVSDATERPRVKVTGWGLDERCPNTPLPLAGEAMTLPLQTLIETTLRRGITRQLDQSQPVPESLSESVRERVEAMIDTSRAD